MSSVLVLPQHALQLAETEVWNARHQKPAELLPRIVFGRRWLRLENSVGGSQAVSLRLAPILIRALESALFSTHGIVCSPVVVPSPCSASSGSVHVRVRHLLLQHPSRQRPHRQLPSRQRPSRQRPRRQLASRQRPSRQRPRRQLLSRRHPS